MNHSIRVTEDVFKQIFDMTRTAIRLPGSFKVGDGITFGYSHEDGCSAVDRYVSHVESLTLGYQLVCFVWPLAAPTKALVHLCDTADSIQDGMKMVQILDLLRAHLK